MRDTAAAAAAQPGEALALQRQRAPGRLARLALGLYAMLPAMVLHSVASSLRPLHHVKNACDTATGLTPSAPLSWLSAAPHEERTTSRHSPHLLQLLWQ